MKDVVKKYLGIEILDATYFETGRFFGIEVNFRGFCVLTIAPFVFGCIVGAWY